MKVEILMVKKINLKFKAILTCGSIIKLEDFQISLEILFKRKL